MQNLRRNLPFFRRQADERVNPLISLQRDFDDFFDRIWRRWPQTTTPSLFGSAEPTTDVSETENEVEVSIELPGIDEKDVEVTISEDMLTVRGEKRAEKEEKKKGYYLSERSFGSFHRVIPLPHGLDTDKAEARFKKGVLTVRLPKTEDAKSRMKRIEVKSG